MPGDLRASVGLGLALMKLKQFGSAYVFLSAVAASDPSAGIFSQLFHRVIGLGRPSEARGFLLQALEMDGDCEEAHCVDRNSKRAVSGEWGEARWSRLVLQTGFDVPDAVAGSAQVLTTGGAWRFQVWCPFTLGRSAQASAINRG